MPQSPRAKIQRRLARTRRRVLFELRYLGLVGRSIGLTLLFAAAIMAYATLVLHEGYPPPPGSPRFTWDVIAFNVFLMTAFGGGLPFNPKAPLLVNAFFFALPLLGLSVIVSAIARFTGLLFQRRWNTKEYQELLASTYQNHVIVGGLGSMWGTLIGGFVLGVTHLIGLKIDPNSGLLYAHIVFFIILTIMPRGISGWRQ